MRYPVIEQSNESDCAAASLYMLLKYYGGYASLEKLKKITHTTEAGTSLYNLKLASEFLGFDSKCYQTDLDNLLKEKRSPFIAHTLVDNIYYHFVVVYKNTKDNLLIADPATGTIEKVSKDAFNHIFQGNVMFLNPIRPLYKEEKFKKIDWFKKLLKGKKKSITKLLILSLISLILEIICASMFYVFLEVLNYQNIHLLIQVILISLIIFIIKNIITFYKDRALCFLEGELEVSMKEECLKNILSLPYPDVRSKDLGKTNHALSQVEEIVSFILQYFLTFTFDIPFLVILIFICILINPIGLVLPFIFLIKLKLSKKIYKNQKKEVRKMETNSMKVKKEETNILKYIENIKNENLESRLGIRMHKNYGTYLVSKCNFIHKMISFETWKECIYDIFFHIEQLYLLVIILFKKITLTKGIYLFQILSILDTTTDKIAITFLEKEKIDIYLEKYDVFNIEETPYKIKKIDIKNGCCNVIESLKDISINLKLGESLLLFGKSGIGKTTLLHAIKGDYDISNYKINDTLNNVPKSRFYYLNQNPYILEDTIINNITYEKNISNDDIKNVLKIVNLDINLDPFSLSSGERQKLALARALLSDFDVLILDESLNQIGEDEECQIIRRVKKLLKDKILIVVSHRKNLINDFSNIATITEEGYLEYKERR